MDERKALPRTLEVLQAAFLFLAQCLRVHFAIGRAAGSGRSAAGQRPTAISWSSPAATGSCSAVSRSGANISGQVGIAHRVIGCSVSQSTLKSQEIGWMTWQSISARPYRPEG